MGMGPGRAPVGDRPSGDAIFFAMSSEEATNSSTVREGAGAAMVRVGRWGSLQKEKPPNATELTWIL